MRRNQRRLTRGWIVSCNLETCTFFYSCLFRLWGGTSGDWLRGWIVSWNLETCTFVYSCLFRLWGITSGVWLGGWTVSCWELVPLSTLAIPAVRGNQRRLIRGWIVGCNLETCTFVYSCLFRLWGGTSGDWLGGWTVSWNLETCTFFYSCLFRLWGGTSGDWLGGG